jgi:hypothetical protein
MLDRAEVMTGNFPTQCCVVPKYGHHDWAFRQHVDGCVVNYLLTGTPPPIPRSLGISNLGKTSRQIFEFKVLTRKIFRNKDLRL